MSSVNTQFSIAVHLLAGLASREGLVTSEALAESVNTNPVFVKRILAKVSKAALIHTQSGKAGGCALARAAKDITLLDVYRAVEAPDAFGIHQYPVNRGCEISRGIKGAMGEVSSRAQRAFEKELERTTIAQVLRTITAG